MSKGSALIVTGTDTGVGKTLVSALAVASFMLQGKKTALYKPVETGISSLEQSDTRQVQRCLEGLPVPESASFTPVVGRYFEAPATPAVANTSGRALQLTTLLEEAQTLQNQHEALVIEGAGGLYVPLTPYACMLDLFRLLKLPCLLVSRPNLGTLNHTILSYQALRREGVPVLAVVLNEGATPLSSEEKESLAVQTVKAQLQQWLPCPVLGLLPHQTELNAGSVGVLLEQLGMQAQGWPAWH